MLTTEEIRQFMEEDNVSQKKQFARKGQEYYDGDHDIRHYRMFYYNEDGNLVEDKTRSNAKYRIRSLQSWWTKQCSIFFLVLMDL